MLTQLLRESGCKLPTDLVGPNITNPDGHFEDFRVIKFHDYLLSKAGVSWQFGGEISSLPNDEKALSSLLAQLTVNLKSDSTLLVKDPRICLFLDHWQDVLQEKAKYVFVARHWLYSIESLLSRHSIRLAEAIKTGKLARHLNFWLDPSLAARMWLTYNRALLHFKRRHATTVTFHTQRGLDNAANLTQSLRAIGIECLETTASSRDASKLKSAVSSRILALVPAGLQNEMQLLWQDILQEVDWRADDEKPVFYYPKDTELHDKASTGFNSALECVTPESAELSLHFEDVATTKFRLEQTENLPNNQANTIGFVMRRVDLLLQLNLTEQAISELHQFVHINPEQTTAWVKLFALMETAIGFARAKKAYENAISNGLVSIKQIDTRIQLREDFPNARSAYFNQLNNLASLAEKQQFVSQLCQALPSPDARQDLIERLWKIWS
ncbi:hypothetical protein [Rheinheimera maricola]|uniref:Tetratricopeptide repeat protein n=1 Tax=Rheinheimera maricola TaxID=2793282 RepID=A0ABS7X480_9GAMM|nr:hypothetical protein [Rheinheimera maricola]MBZ9610336.1 hypothetical protein [Rheinheimera maricola]